MLIARSFLLNLFESKKLCMVNFKSQLEASSSFFHRVSENLVKIHGGFLVVEADSENARIFFLIRDLRSTFSKSVGMPRIRISYFLLGRFCHAPSHFTDIAGIPWTRYAT